MGRTSGVVGIDVGTTSVKAVVVGADGSTIGTGHSDSITTLRPSPELAEQDPSEIWSAVGQAIGAALQSTPSIVNIQGVSLASQSGSVVRLDATGKPIGMMTTWMDQRSKNIVARWEVDQTAARTRSVSGWAPSTGLGTIAWFYDSRGNPPRQPTKAAMVGGVDSFVTWHLGGSWTTNPSNATGLGLMELTTSTWSNEIASIIGIDTSVLPELRETGDEVGSIDVSAAASTGLAVGTPLFSGAHDQTCTALAVGVANPGQVLLSGGTAWVLTQVVDTPEIPALKNVKVSRHITPGRWTRSRLLGDFGAQLQMLAPGGPDTFFSDASNGPRDDSADPMPSRHAPFFVAGQFVDEQGDIIDPPEKHKIVAVMEAAGLTLADALSAEPTASNVTLVGGVTAGDVWPQILADITGRNMVSTEESSWPAIGAALVAGASAGLFEMATNAQSIREYRKKVATPRLDTMKGYRLRAEIFHRLTERAAQ